MNIPEIEIQTANQNFKHVETEPLVSASQALSASSTRSPKYTFVPTRSLVERLAEAGWNPVRSRQVRVRDQARQGFQKHAVWLRQAGIENSLIKGEFVVELILINAHDGSSSYQLHGGLYRTYCANGIVFSDSTFEAIRFPHRGSRPEKVVEASLRLVSDIPRLVSRVEAFRGRVLRPSEQFEFAQTALSLRYPENPPCDPGTLLHCRRHEDFAGNLWTTLNKVQENLLRGGSTVSDTKRTPAGRIRAVRPCSGIDRSVSLNKGLWNLADSFLARN